LNNKLNNLRPKNNKLHTTQTHTTNTTDNITSRQETFPFYQKIQNLTDISLSKEETTLLERGFQYNLEAAPKKWTRDFIIDIETAIN
jgi:hypothetical protein